MPQMPFHSDQTAVPPRCKCCGRVVALLGRIDFNRSCLDRIGTRVFPPSHRLLPYWRCEDCGFIFTDQMDAWSAEDFKREIYNDDYIKVDPPIPGRSDVPARQTPAYQAGRHIASFFGGGQNAIRILDFGAGGDPGPTGLALIDQGFTVQSHDPYRSDVCVTEDSRYDLIIAIEVLEHCNDLRDVQRFMQTHLADGGLLWIQTLLHPHPAPPDILSSWYIAPRNGHISIFSFVSLHLLFRQVGINIVQTPFATIGFRTLPKFPNTVFV